MYARKIDKSNQLSKEIEKLLELCDKYDEENDGECSFFDKPVSEEEMLKWEQDNGARIPESYKEWLRFTGRCRIAQNTASFWGPNEFHSKYVPEDMVVIGELIGDGELVCFSKKKEEIVNIFEGRENYKSSFFDVVKEIIDMLDNKPILSLSRVDELLAKFEEDRKKGLV
ncbi:MAG: SMI1/KNR4 family protein [Lachnospiraceae bacterium]|nr:SMI1/KNR4 family protein [Lachnospiraceae bacterium]